MAYAEDPGSLIRMGKITVVSGRADVIVLEEAGIGNRGEPDPAAVGQSDSTVPPVGRADAADHHVRGPRHGAPAGHVMRASCQYFREVERYHRPARDGPPDAI